MRVKDIYEWQVGKDLEGGNHDLLEHTVLASTYNEWSQQTAPTRFETKYLL